MLKKFLRLFLFSAFAIVAVTGCRESVSIENNKGHKVITENEIFLRLAETHPDNHPTTIGDKEFARLVEERSSGRIKVVVYPESILGQEKAVVEQLQFGAIDFARISVVSASELAKELNVIQLPYLYRNEEHMWKVLEGPIGDRLLKSIQNAKLIGLAWYDAGARNLYSKKEVKSLGDLKDLKIRVQQSNLMIRMIMSLGASPAPMDMGGVYNALLTGSIDGVEDNMSSYISTGHVEVAKYILQNDFTRVPEILVASQMVMYKLSKEDQDLIRKAAKDSVKVQKEAFNKKEKESEEKAKLMGVKISTFDEKSLIEFQNAVKPVYDEIGKDHRSLLKKIQDTK